MPAGKDEIYLSSTCTGTTTKSRGAAASSDSRSATTSDSVTPAAPSVSPRAGRQSAPRTVRSPRRERSTARATERSEVHAVQSALVARSFTPRWQRSANPFTVLSAGQVRSARTVPRRRGGRSRRAPDAYPTTDPLGPSARPRSPYTTGPRNSATSPRPSPGVNAKRHFWNSATRATIERPSPPPRPRDRAASTRLRHRSTRSSRTSSLATAPPSARTSAG